jgi:hypothetical protein
MKALCLFLIACAFFTRSNAQNIVKILEPGDEIPGVLSRDSTAENGWEIFDYHITPPPPGVVDGIAAKRDYVQAANRTVIAFQISHLQTYSYINFGRTFLDAGAYWYSGKHYDPEYDSVESTRMKKSIFGSRALREMIYSWLIPFYKAAFSVMSVPEQNTFLEMFRDARNYATTFDLVKEKAAATGDEPWAFLETRGDHNAFVYRRIANGELSREECIEWIDRIILDFTSVMRKDPAPADEFVLKQDIGNGYYTASSYRLMGRYENRDIRIVRKANGQYTLMPGVEFSYVQDVRMNLIHGSLASEQNGKRFGIFCCDSAGWTFTPTAMEPYDVDDVLYKGSGKDMRFLMVYGEDYSYFGDNPQATRVFCALVDRDSGTIVRDSMLIPAFTWMSADTYDYVFSYPAKEEELTVFTDRKTGLMGVFDSSGTIVLPPIYKRVEKTTDPRIVKVNGRKKVSVYGGGKPRRN